MKNVAENQIKDQEWTILRNGPFVFIFVTVNWNKLATFYFTANHTAKFLIGVTPSGVVVYSSSAYPGSTTDKEIVVASGVLNQLKTGDNVMADKGFLIHDILPGGT